MVNKNLTKLSDAEVSAINLATVKAYGVATVKDEVVETTRVATKTFEGQIPGQINPNGLNGVWLPASAGEGDIISYSWFDVGDIVRAEDGSYLKVTGKAFGRLVSHKTVEAQIRLLDLKAKVAETNYKIARVNLDTKVLQKEEAAM